MPFIIQTTINIEGQGQGFSEDFSWQSNSDDLNLAETLVTPVFQKRAKLMANGYVLAVVRNAVIRDAANKVVKRTTDIIEPRLQGVAAWGPAPPNLSLMCLWQTGDNKFAKKQYMRGVPGGLGDSGKAPDFSFGVFASNFNAWRTAMQDFGAGWLVTAPTQTAVINSYTIDATSGIVTFVLGGAGLTWPNGVGFKQRVYVQLPGKSPLDGPIVVIPAAAPDTATKCTTATPIGVHPFIPGQLGIMQIRDATLKTLQPVGGQGPQGIIHPQRMVTRKTGSPSYASRGRRPARTKW